MRQLLILTLLISSALVVACGGSGPTPAPTQAPTQPTNAPASTQAVTQPTIAAVPTQAAGGAPTAAVNPPAPSGSEIPDAPSGAPLDIVKKASLDVFSANSVRAVTLIEPADGSQSTLTLEYVKPDRIHVVQSDGAENIAIKGVGFWTKTADIWEMDGPRAAEFLFAFLDAQALEQSFKVIQVDSIQFVGAELLNGKPTFVYTYKTVVEFGEQKSNGIGKLWVGALDGRAYKGESTSDSFATPGKQDHTIVTYEYDIPITIQAPQ